MEYFKKIIAIYVFLVLNPIALSASVIQEKEAFQSIFTTCVKNAAMINQLNIGAAWPNTDNSILEPWVRMNLDLAKLSPDMAPNQGGRGRLVSWQPIAKEKIETACRKLARDNAEFFNKRVITAPQKYYKKNEFNIYYRRTHLTLPLIDVEKDRFDNREGYYNFMALGVVYDDKIICVDELSAATCKAPNAEILDKDAKRALEEKSCRVEFLVAPEGPVFGGRYFDSYRRTAKTYSQTNNFFKNGGRGYMVSPFGIPLLRLWRIQDDNWSLVNRYTFPSFKGFRFQDKAPTSVLELVESSTDSFEKKIDWEKIKSELVYLGAQEFSAVDLPKRDLISEMSEPECIDALKVARQQEAE